MDKAKSETQMLRAKIRAKLLEIEHNLEGFDAQDLERQAKALGALFKLTKDIDEHDECELRLSLLKNENTHTPYDQIPPPNEEEMRAIQDRLNSLYNRLRAAEDPVLGDGSTGEP